MKNKPKVVYKSNASWAFNQATNLANLHTLWHEEYHTALQAENSLWYITNEFDPEVRKCN